VIDYDALAGRGLRLLGDYCDGPHGGGANYEGVFRVPGDAPLWYCKPCFVDRWKALGCPELPSVVEPVAVKEASE
jgi:hypothetical protein